MRKGLKDEVIAYVSQHPSATARDVAKALNCMEEYVRSTARRQGIKLARTRIPRLVARVARASSPRVRIKTFSGTHSEYDAMARMIPLTELGPRDCRWPLGDPQSGDFGFCGHVKLAGKSMYCAHHQMRCEGVGTTSERSAHRVLRRAA